MSHRRVPLELIRLPTPCPADWNAMRGDDRVRFCDHCAKPVYNLTDLPPAAAERLLAEHGDDLPCVRLYRRRDGTVATADCQPLWRRAARPVTTGARWLVRAVAAIAGLSVATGGCATTGMVYRADPDGAAGSTADVPVAVPGRIESVQPPQTLTAPTSGPTTRP